MEYSKKLYGMFAYEIQMGGYVMVLEKCEGYHEPLPAIYVPGIFEGRNSRGETIPGRLPILCEKIRYDIFVTAESMMAHLIGTYVDFLSRYQKNPSLYNYGLYIRDVVIPNLYHKLIYDDDDIQEAMQLELGIGKYINPEVDRLYDGIIPFKEDKDN